MAEQILNGPMNRLLTGLQSQSYGAHVLGISGTPKTTDIDASITITWSGSQTGTDETNAAAYIAAFDWQYSTTERVAQLNWNGEVLAALIMQVDRLRRGDWTDGWDSALIATERAKVENYYNSVAPTNTVPGAQTIATGLTITFSGAKQISIADAALTGNIKVTLTVTSGTLTLSGTTGLTFTTGDGTNDATMVFTGTLTNCNNAINGMTYTAPGGAGSDTLTITADDQANTVFGAATGINLWDRDTVAITINTLSSSEAIVGTGLDDSSYGTATWLTPTNIQTDDTNYATCPNAPMGADTKSHYLKGRNCGFMIASDKTIAGIEVKINRKKTGTHAITDDRVRIVKADGTIGTTDKSTGSAWTTSDVEAVYGSSSDLWGETWTYADINDADFGAVIAVNLVSGMPPADAQVDYMKIKVYYY